MKAALNGALNCSILDGWWSECYDGSNGWAIGSAEASEDTEYQDRVDANAFYDLLEREIVPRFYDRSEGPVPRRWIERMKASISSLGGVVSADRMVRDYVELLYEPSAAMGARMSADGYGRARALAEWKANVREVWGDVQVLQADGDITAGNVGQERKVSALVKLGRLSPDDVAVQVAHGRVGANGELIEPALVQMASVSSEDGVCSFEASFGTDDAGLYGYTVRVLPWHPDLTSDMELGVVAWA